MTLTIIIFLSLSSFVFILKANKPSFDDGYVNEVLVADGNNKLALLLTYLGISRFNNINMWLKKVL